MNFNEELQVFRSRIEDGLKQYVPLDGDTPSRLLDAMKHSLFAGGKRIRPVMLLSLFEMKPTALDPIPAAVAIECLHTYSLIHDDLPAMDDSNLRRGVATCHVAFDEATAILAGDALLTLAFEILSTHYQDHPQIACSLVRELARAAGSGKLVGGQMEDILQEKSEGDCGGSLDDITRIEDNKTGALFKASLRMGLILAQRPEDLLKTASELGEVIGRSFQIVDDMLDALGDEKTVGKSLKLDERNAKITAVSHLGLEGSKKRVERLHDTGIKLSKKLGETPGFFISLLDYLKTRVN